MKIHYLAYLVDIAGTGSINFSAERFFITQQSMSRAIKSMENELGMKLLERTYTGVSLTEAGKVVVEKGQLIINLMQAVHEELAEIEEIPQAELSGELIIRGNFQAMSSVIPSVVNHFVRRYPNVSLSIEGERAYCAVKEVYDGQADLALVGIAPRTIAEPEDYRPMLESLRTQKLYEDDILICLSKNLSLAGREYLEPKDLLRIPQINYGFQPPVNDILFGHNSRPKQLLETTSIDLFKKTIRQGLGFGLTNGLDARLNYHRLELNDIAFVPLYCADNTITYLLAVRPENGNHKLCQAFSASVEHFIQSL